MKKYIIIVLLLVVPVLTGATGRKQAAAGKLLTFELEPKPVSRNIYMVYRKKSDLSDLAREFARQVRRDGKE